MKHDNITYNIISCTYTVYNTLGFGFLESVYKRALVIELQKRDLSVEEEKPLTVFYRNQVVGEFYVDLLVEEEIVVELKSVQQLNKEHEVQVVNYLNGLRRDIGLLINFGPQGVEVRRKYPSPPSPEESWQDLQKWAEE